MAPTEKTEGQSPHEQQTSPVEIGIKPFKEAGIIFERADDGRLIFKITGEITIAILPSGQAAESAAAAAETKPSSSIPERTSPPVTDQYSGSDKPSWERPLKEGEEIPASENEKFQLEGNPAKILGYRVTRKSNTRIADFVLATHPSEEATEYWRIRAFGDEAEKVRDQVEVGQKGIEATVYGPKYWKGRKKTKDGWEDTVVKGYNAGFVKVPRKYRSEEQPAEKPQLKPEN